MVRLSSIVGRRQWRRREERFGEQVDFGLELHFVFFIRSQPLSRVVRVNRSDDKEMRCESSNAVRNYDCPLKSYDAPLDGSTSAAVR